MGHGTTDEGVSLALPVLIAMHAQVYRRLEEIINNCSYMDWKHFDAGVVKVRGRP